jgi:hypothetical protein
MTTSTRRNTYLNTIALLGLVATLCMGLPTDAQAKKRRTTDETGQTKSQRASKITFNSGSQEGVRDRDRRLSRECKGMTNAGACAGYTR